MKGILGGQEAKAELEEHKYQPENESREGDANGVAEEQKPRSQGENGPGPEGHRTSSYWLNKVSINVYGPFNYLI